MWRLCEIIFVSTLGLLCLACNTELRTLTPILPTKTVVALPTNVTVVDTPASPSPNIVTEVMPPITPTATHISNNYAVVETATPTLVSIVSTPIVSSDLKSLYIAFIRNGKIGIWHNGIIQLLDNVHAADASWGAVALADDGKVVAFVSEGELWAINSDNSKERLLVSAAHFKSMPPVDPGVRLSQFGWIPNTHKLLFNTTLNTGYGITNTDDLYLVDADTQQWVNLFPPYSGGGYFYFSPDGQKVALVTPSQIRLIDADGKNGRTLLDFVSVSTASEFWHYPPPVWSPDSNSLRLAL
ncbi:MAG: hypothetical protein U0401_34645 [Anaerolineae bacterium]